MQLQQVEEELSLSIAKITPLAGDGSDRSFHRIHTEQAKTYVLMSLSEADGKLLQAGNYDWLEIAATLAAADVSCPQVIATVANTIVIEDGGDHTLQRKLNRKNREELFQRCFSTAKKLLSIQQHQQQVWSQRKFDQQFYLQELKFFQQMYIDRYLKLTPTMQDRLTHDFHCLSDYLAKFSNYFVHRDFHSRNIMVTDGAIMLLDFQDACVGSPLYDLVSLCFDSYLPLSAETRLKLFTAGCEELRRAHPEIDTNHWTAVLLQRQLKAIGSFAKLTHVVSKGNYMRYVPNAVAVLPRKHLADKRWEYLSDTLLTQIANRHAQD